MLDSNIIKLFRCPTRENIFWTLPDLELVVNLLRCFGGNLPEMLKAIADDERDQAQLAFLIEELLDQPENENYKKLWEKYQLLYYKSQLTLGTATVLKDYAKGKADKHQFIKDVGKNVLPGVFAPGIGIGGKREIEQQVDTRLAAYGDQPEEHNS